MPSSPTRRSLLALAAFMPRPASAETLVEPVMRLAGPAEGRRRVALTLDCCPGGFDPRIAEVVLALEVPVTCCLTASWMRQNPEALRLLLAHPRLFGLANHGARHVPPVLGQRQVFGLTVAGDTEAIIREVSEGAAAIAALGGAAPRWYRAATGYYSPAAIPLIRSLGAEIAGYSLSADMGASLPAAATAARLGQARDGEVVVAHLNQPHRAAGAGVAAGIAALHAAGTRFVRLDELDAAAVVYG